MTNLFPNPSVEENIDGFSFAWGTASGEQSTDWAQDGTKSIKITSSDGGWLNGGSVASPSTNYVFSVYAKGAGNLQMGWRAKDVSEAQLDSFAFGTPVALTSEPQQISVAFTTTNPATAGLVLIAYNTTGGGQVWYTDWHQLEVGTTPTPYPSGNPYARIRSQFELRPY
jgi:hypothetical protein